MTTTTLTDTIVWARSIPRHSRVAQGYPRLRDFAKHVQKTRARRAELAAKPRNPVRDAILARMRRILETRHDLQLAARRVASDCGNRGWQLPVSVCWATRNRARVPVETGSGYYFRWRGKWKTARGSYIPSSRKVLIPAAWLLGRLMQDTEARYRRT